MRDVPVARDAATHVCEKHADHGDGRTSAITSALAVPATHPNCPEGQVGRVRAVPEVAQPDVRQVADPVVTVLLGDRLTELPSVLRTFVLATLAVPIVVYGVLPHLHRARGRLLGGGT